MIIRPRGSLHFGIEMPEDINGIEFKELLRRGLEKEIERSRIDDEWPQFLDGADGDMLFLQWLNRHAVKRDDQ